MVKNSYLERIKIQTRKNHKKWLRKKYKYLKNYVELTIENSRENQCYVEFKQDYRFITWLIKKKLEREGFECLLLEDFCGSFNDILEIKWE